MDEESPRLACYNGIRAIDISRDANENKDGKKGGQK
jgi:hypothetical protein